MRAGFTLARPILPARIGRDLDDAMEYATDEPTMDGTAAAVLMLALWTAPPARMTN